MFQKREPNYIWVSCDGQSPHDRENQGELQYIPQPGFPYYFYPYLNTKDYMSPLVAVQFVKPQREYSTIVKLAHQPSYVCIF